MHVRTLQTAVLCRVARQLLLLARRFGTREGDALRVVHELTQAEMAQLVGADRAMVNKALQDFVSRGWIRMDDKSVLIVDRDALACQAGTSSSVCASRRRQPLRATNLKGNGYDPYDRVFRISTTKGAAR